MQNAEVGELQDYYDRWSAQYDSDLEALGYEAPKVAALTLAQYNLDSESAVLDVGCGTGLTGQALFEKGFKNITGLDISNASLELASAKNCYRQLTQGDINEKFAFPDNAFAAAQCIGTLSYVRNIPAFMRELCRVVMPQGFIMFTHRQDLHDDTFKGYLASLATEGKWELVDHSEPKPYLPNFEDFDSEQDIHYDVYRVLA